LSKGLTKLRAKSASTFMGYPSRSLKIVGVTGTDGKTTTTELIAALLSASGRRVSCINSIGASIAGQRLESRWNLTTPGPFVIQGLLRSMKRCGSEWAIIEASSHGLAQWRLGGIAFHVGVMTNLTPEHLDYHRGMDRYAAAKAILLRNVIQRGSGKGTVILNRDDPSYGGFAALSDGVQVSYGLSPAADVRASSIDLDEESSTFEVATPRDQFRVVLALPGLFNVYNALAAVAVGYSQGVDPTSMAEGLRSVTQLRGRMSPISEGQPYSVMIDHAHTPHALEQVLRFFREKVKGRIIVVFGCPGERWPGKRLPMGEIAGLLADRVVLTREDDRSESVYAIMHAIAEGLQRAGRQEGVDYVLLPDRREAIQRACDMAEAGDLVLIAGKGHEPTINVNGRDLPWQEEAVARDAIRRRMGLSSVSLR
ncbi:MAG TPA: UDP-N-acetylmuramoyl-L-alanyl-D-glutamate--2,6-diaminopimelate ligase, partial [Thermoleophilia bacterium]|nr:UDP-N-acetylmuramoyl-L-alanyl-D-glutamate--2,6-diaminopimelate ligase [Thermoleophilia bacterium]